MIQQERGNKQILCIDAAIKEYKKLNEMLSVKEKDREKEKAIEQDSIVSSLKLKTEEEYVMCAKLAEKAKIYSDMLDFIEPVISKLQEPTIENRDLFSISCKKLSGNYRKAWRALDDIDCTHEYEKYLTLIKKYKKVLEEKIVKVSERAHNLITRFVERNLTTIESKVFYIKMKADYYRYNCEVTSGSVWEKANEESEKYYKAARKLAGELPVTHLIRLGLDLNISVFAYDKKNTEEAIRISKKTIDAVESETKKTGKELSGDSAVILKLMKENIELWTTTK